MASDAEAVALLRMLLDKMKPTSVSHGVNLSIELTEAEMNRLMHWADSDDDEAAANDDWQA